MRCIVYLIILVIGMAALLGFMGAILISPDFRAEILGGPEVVAKQSTIQTYPLSQEESEPSEKDNMLSIVWTVVGTVCMFILSMGVANYLMAHADHQKLENRHLSTMLAEGSGNWPLESNSSYSHPHFESNHYPQAEYQPSTRHVNSSNTAYSEPYPNHVYQHQYLHPSQANIDYQNGTVPQHAPYQTNNQFPNGIHPP